MERVLEPGGDYIPSRFETHTLGDLLMSEGRTRSRSGVKERRGDAVGRGEERDAVNTNTGLSCIKYTL